MNVPSLLTYDKASHQQLLLECDAPMCMETRQNQESHPEMF